MNPIKGYNAAQELGDFERLPAGGYVIRITDVKDDKKKSYLRVVYDIAEGPEAGRFKNETPDNEFRHSFPASYKETALGGFKRFIKAVDASNKTNFNETAENGLDEDQLVGKLLGVVLGYEEYKTNDGYVKERLALPICMSAERIRKGDFKVPELKKLKADQLAIPETPPAGFTPFTDDNIPF